MGGQGTSGRPCTVPAVGAPWRYPVGVHTLLLATAALAAPPPLCPMPAVLGALQGGGPPPHPVVLAAPEALRAPADPPPPDGRPIQGTRMDHHVDSAHFTVAWAEGRGDLDSATAASDALELAWSALVDDAGFRAPASSDAYLIWVVLEPGLGATGLTTEYRNAAYPSGYPVIFLDPSWAGDAALWQSVAAHELAHAIQFAYRDYDGDAEDALEPWYWEASAEWSAALARPDLDVYAASSRHYATATAAPHWTMERSHQYGMFVVNAHLEENLMGPGAMRAAWERGASRPGDAWHTVLADISGLPPAAVFGGAAVAYAMGGLDDADRYWPATVAGIVRDGAQGTVGWLGARLYVADADATVESGATTGAVTLAAPGAVGRSVQIRAGEVLAVVGTADADNAFRLTISPPVSAGGGGAADPGTPRSTRSGVSSGFGTEGEAGCAVVPRPRGVGAALVWIGLSVCGRRRSRASGRGASSRTA